MGTSYHGGAHRWIPKVWDVHAGTPDFLWHPRCYADEYGTAELERLIGECWRWQLRRQPRQLGPGS
ncbi:hypothetical protein [Streptomyces sp. TLI_171]|uniref:hypothetical protein n=1 Tax=Streptomyces sp. TLI_171 TaxID=1938859 RepID=UPI000C4A2A94|nr:hypothetical protein [Streptomyces sp. TLI_171]RKE16917.1 hypothetical protein BX266_0163 [Streptomyces sp. TLI_171]